MRRNESHGIWYYLGIIIFAPIVLPCVMVFWAIAWPFYVIAGIRKGVKENKARREMYWNSWYY